MNANKEKLKKIGNIALNVLTYVFIVLCIVAVLFTIFSKKDIDGAAEIFGYQMRIVETDSMAKCELTDVSDYDIKSIPRGSLIFIKLMPDDDEKADEWYASIKEGDVLTFRYVYTSQVTITHRVSSIEKKSDGGYLINLEGDNKNLDTDTLTQTIDTSIPDNTNYVLGKVTGQSVLLGFIFSLLKSTAGIILIVIVPCLIIIVLEVMKIVETLSADKKAKRAEEDKKKDEELEALRRRLNELENKEPKNNPSEDNKEE